MKKEVVAEMLAAFIGEGQRVEKLPEGDPQRVAGERAGAYFTDGVGTLKTLFPNPDIRDLMSMVWNIVGSRIVATAMGPEVPCLTLAVVGTKLMPQAMIFVPPTWIDMIHKDPLYQLGGLVFVGSQAVDYYNGRIMFEPEAAKKRARAHEAEYLVTLRESAPDLKLNEWQQGVLKDFPEGIRSERILPLLYKRKAFVPPA